MEQRLSPPWHPLEAIPVALAALVTGVLASVILAATLGGVGGTVYLLAAVAFQAGLAAFSILWIAIRHRGWVAALGLRSRRPARDVAVGAWAGAGLFAVVAFLLYPAFVVLIRVLTGGPPDPINQPVLPSDPTPGEVVLGVVAVVLAAPVGEEIFFRGFLYGSLRGRFGFWVSGSVSAVVFAVFHGDAVLAVMMFFVGLALAYLYQRRGSLAAPIAAHAVFNVVGYALIVMERT
ncbi:MAG: lysostaphin resistance A-like protein [Actinomycetota bacterium]